MLTKFAAVLFLLWGIGASASASQIQASPISVYLTAQVNGPTAYQTVTVFNQGPDVTSGVTVSDFCGADFYISNFCPFTLNPYQSCQINIQFRPSFERNQFCTVQVNSTNGGFASISVNGRGVKNLVQENHLTR